MHNMKQKADCEASQDNKSAREEFGAWKVEINWNNCLLQRWICYRYYGYSQQNDFAGSTLASLDQLLHFSCTFMMWNHDILDLRRIFALQVRKLRRISPFVGSNTKAWIEEGCIGNKCVNNTHCHIWVTLISVKKYSR